MTSLIHNALTFKQLLSSILGEISTKSYFSYYGFRKDKILFALFKDNNFYLKIPNDVIDKLLPHDGVIQLNDKTSGIHSQNFYQIPHSLIVNRTLFTFWLNTCLSALKIARQTSPPKARLIRYMPNMTAHTEKTLKKLGIYSVDDLITKGAIDTFIELLIQGFDVEQSMLFKLHCAIHHQFIYTLSASEKSVLLNEANNALYKAGLRKRFRFY